MKQNHIERESPWSHTKYVIRKVDPALLNLYAIPESKEAEQIRSKINELLEDRQRETDKIDAINKQRDEEGISPDGSMVKAINEKIAEIDDKILRKNAVLTKQLLEEADIIEYRVKILDLGLIGMINGTGNLEKINIKTKDDYLDLGMDGSFIYANIVSQSRAPDKYFEELNKFFRGESIQPDNSEGGKDSKDVPTTPKPDN